MMAAARSTTSAPRSTGSPRVSTCPFSSQASPSAPTSACAPAAEMPASAASSASAFPSVPPAATTVTTSSRLRLRPQTFHLRRPRRIQPARHTRGLSRLRLTTARDPLHRRRRPLLRRHPRLPRAQTRPHVRRTPQVDQGLLRPHSRRLGPLRFRVLAHLLVGYQPDANQRSALFWPFVVRQMSHARHRRLFTRAQMLHQLRTR